MHGPSLVHVHRGSLTLSVLGTAGVWLMTSRRATLNGMTSIYTSTPAPTVAPFTRRQLAALAVLLMANFTLAVDFSILNVALPHIGHDLGLATGALQWIVTSFALCAAGFTLFFGRVADLFGRRRLFMVGIVLLGASSLAGGLASGPGVLIVARIGQGVATAIVTPAALSLMTTMFPDGPARSRALGLNGALMAAGFTTGAVLGGVLTGAVSWRWAFFINVAVAVAVVVVAPFVLRETRDLHRPRLDAPGAVTVTLALVALVFGIDTAGRSGWTHVGSWAPIVAAVVLLGLFWQIESRVDQPLVSPALLSRRSVAWGNTAGLLAFATETSLVFLLTLYLQEVLGYSAVTTGLVLAVLGAGTVIGGLVAPRVIGSAGSRTAIVLGLIVQAAATVPLAFVSSDRGWLVPLLLLAFLGGVANLVAIVGFVVTSTAGVPAADQGLATGLVTMSQQVGIALGTPVMSAIVTAWATSALLDGLQVAIGVNAALALVTGLLVASRLRASGNPVSG